jgi:hypothetical protein
LRSAWPATPRAFKPLARAVTTYCSPSASSILERVSRAMMAAFRAPSVIAGSTRCRPMGR